MLAWDAEVGDRGPVGVGFGVLETGGICWDAYWDGGSREQVDAADLCCPTEGIHGVDKAGRQGELPGWSQLKAAEAADGDIVMALFHGATGLDYGLLCVHIGGAAAGLPFGGEVL